MDRLGEIEARLKAAEAEDARIWDDMRPAILAWRARAFGDLRDLLAVVLAARELQNLLRICLEPQSRLHPGPVAGLLEARERLYAALMNLENGR